MTMFGRFSCAWAAAMIGGVADSSDATAKCPPAVLSNALASAPPKKLLVGGLDGRHADQSTAGGRPQVTNSLDERKSAALSMTVLLDYDRTERSTRWRTRLSPRSGIVGASAGSCRGENCESAGFSES